MLEHEWMVTPHEEENMEEMMALHKSNSVPFQSCQSLVAIINQSIELRRQLETDELDALKQKTYYTV